MQGKTESTMKISASRASKRAPTWHSCTITPKSLSGQPLDRLIQTRSRGWPEKDFGVIVQLCHVGARFEALDTLIFIAPSVSPCIFNVPRFPSGTMCRDNIKISRVFQMCLHMTYVLGRLFVLYCGLLPSKSTEKANRAAQNIHCMWGLIWKLSTLCG